MKLSNFITKLLNDYILWAKNVVYFCSKYEEIYPPEVGEFVYITDNTYTKKQVCELIFHSYRQQ